MSLCLRIVLVETDMTKLVDDVFLVTHLPEAFLLIHVEAGLSLCVFSSLVAMALFLTFLEFVLR